MPLAQRVDGRCAEDTRTVIEAFLKNCKEPALLEPGEELIPLTADNFTLDLRGSRLTLQVWDRTRNLSRRVTAVKEATSARLELTVEHFARREGQMFLLDLARRSGADMGRRSGRLVFRERFRLFLRRQFPEWNLAELSAEANLAYSLSPAFPRAFLRHGQHGWAAIACPPEGNAAAVLSFGLIWLTHLRARERRVTVEGLAIYLPAGRESATALRLLCLDPAAAQFALFTYSAEDFVVRIDPADHGNLETHLEHWREPAPNPAIHSEAWLEARARRQIETLDASLLPAPIYGQVPAFAGGERGIMDLLAVDHAGQLSVVELKATADVNLPLQALDYWIRVKWHLGRGEFPLYGYFPGVALLPKPPRLLLVSPSLEFHPATETILGYFAPSIDVERIGLAVEWQHGSALALEVMFRLTGAQRPQ